MSAIMIDKFLLRNMDKPAKKHLKSDRGHIHGMHVPQVIAQAHTLEAARVLQDIRVDIPICNDVYKARLMSLGILQPGFVPLFTNLVRSSYDSKNMTPEMLRQPWLGGWGNHDGNQLHWPQQGAGQSFGSAPRVSGAYGSQRGRCRRHRPPSSSSLWFVVVSLTVAVTVPCPCRHRHRGRPLFPTPTTPP